MCHNNKFQEYNNLGTLATVFQTEIYALSKAAERMLHNDTQNKTIKIFVDSQAALLALDKYIITDKSVQTCKNNINNLANNNNRISLNWIPGHEGFMGNEVADRLAKRGADLEAPDGQIIPVPQTHIKNLIKTWSKKAHQKIWSANPQQYRQSKMFLPDVSNTIWKKIQNQSINRIRITTQIITGHATLRKHLFNMKIVNINTPLCPKCGEENETVEHIFTICPFFMWERANILGKFFIKKDELSSLKLSKVLKFAEKTKRFEPET